jgi:2-hydroxy-6-oxonona-2,4-dienedioate hydrolase
MFRAFVTRESSMLGAPRASAHKSEGLERPADSFRSVALMVDDVATHAVVSHSSDSRRKARQFVLIHGLGLSQRYMMPVARELARDYPVYVPDQPGFGASGHPEQVLDMAGLADAIAAWTRAAGLPRAVLLGNSQGCQIIGQLAVRHPALVEAVIMQGPTAPPGERAWFWQFIRWRQNGRYNPPTLDPITWGEYKKSGYLRVLRTFQYSLKDHLEDQVSHIAAPALIVRGECDPICSASWARRLAELLPNGKFVEIPRVAHTLCYTAPAELAEVTRQFVLETLGR